MWAGIMIGFHQTADTFFVDEVLAYELSGEGPFVFARIEKRETSTQTVKQHLAETTGVPVSHIRHAGFKDAAATAQQWLSWPENLQQRAPVDGKRFAIRELTRHTNTLAVGHVRLNRFRLLLKADQTLDPATVPTLGDTFPNYYGPQRFGRYLRDLDWFPSQLARTNRNKNVISLLQSFLFNTYLRERLAESGKEPREGDFWMRAGAKRWFQSTLDQEIRQRFQRGEIAPTGPMFGYKIQLTDGEAQFLSRWNRSPEDFRNWGKFAKGTRRPLFVKPFDVALQKTSEGSCELSFGLPAGTYATVFLTLAFRPELAARELVHWPNYTKPVTLVGDVHEANH